MAVRLPREPGPMFAMNDPGQQFHTGKVEVGARPVQLLHIRLGDLVRPEHNLPARTNHRNPRIIDKVQHLKFHLPIPDRLRQEE